MNFGHDTEHSLGTAAALVNSEPDDFADPGALGRFLDDHRITGARATTEGELAAVRALAPRLRAVWDAPDTRTAAGVINGLLAESRALPQLVDHDDWDWHLHVTPTDAPVARRLAADAAMALADLVRTGERERLKHCAAPDCDAVLVDLSRNRSRRYCDTGNCGNRLHVAAYRARLRSVGS